MGRLSGPVFVTGVWKSGNHLVYSALNQLGVEGPFNGIAANLLFGRGQTIKRIIRGSLPMTCGIDIGLETGARIRPGYLRKTLRRLHGRIVGGHAAYSDEFMFLLRDEGARIISIRRDPRDVLISFADWIGERPDYFMYQDFVDLNREERVVRLLRGGPGSGYTLVPFTEVLRRARPWLKVELGILPVAFEDLVGPMGGGTQSRQLAVLDALCSHLELTPPAEPEWATRIYGGSRTFNEGRVGRWRELGSNDLKDEIKERLGESLVSWGYATGAET